MLRRSTLFAAVVTAALAATTACRDSLAPSPRAGVPSLATITKTGQCFALEADVASSEVAPGAYDPTVVTAPAGEVVTRAAVQAGSACWLTPSGATGSYTILVEGAPCYLVEGLGTAAVTLLRIGASPTCKNVTHVEYVTAPAVQPGRLQICKEIVNADLGFLVEPFTFLVAGTQVTVPARLYPEYPLALSCAEPIELAAGEYAVTEQRNVSGLAPSSVTIDPADRLLAVDLAMSTATVLVVDGTTTVITFTTVWLPDPET